MAAHFWDLVHNRAIDEGLCFLLDELAFTLLGCTCLAGQAISDRRWQPEEEPFPAVQATPCATPAVLPAGLDGPDIAPGASHGGAP